MSHCTGPFAQSLYCGESCANALTAAVAMATAMRNFRIFFNLLRVSCPEFKQAAGLPIPLLPAPASRPLLLLEVLHLVVQLVHLGVDLFLLQNSLAHQQCGQAVQENPVLDDHLLNLFVVFLVGAVVVPFDVVHRCSSCARRCTTFQRAGGGWQRAGSAVVRCPPSAV